MDKKPYMTTTFLWRLGEGEDPKWNTAIEEWLADQLKDDYVLHSITETAMDIAGSSNISAGGRPIEWIHCRVTVEHLSVRKERGL